MIQCQCQKPLHFANGNFLLDADFSLSKGEILALTGPSGGGKTTLLRLLAGLEKPKKGRILSNQTIWVDTTKKIFISPQKRQVGMVFQDYALFPNMSVRKNLAYGLASNAPTHTVDEMLSILDLVALADTKPYQLSGGQQQRVALGRAIIPKPALLLLDEPLSALDIKFRNQMQTYLLRLHQEYAFSMIIVSHNLQEIYTLAQRIATLDEGKLSIVENNSFQSWTALQSNGLILEGSIIKLIQIKSQTFAIVLIGENSIEILLTEKYEVGQKVRICFQEGSLKII